MPIDNTLVPVVFVLVIIPFIFMKNGNSVVELHQQIREEETNTVRHWRRTLHEQEENDEGGDKHQNKSINPNFTITREHPPLLTGPPPPYYKLEAVGDGAVVASNGRDTNFPSVIRVPDWVPRKSRAHPKAKYYLYYSSHSGNYISMSWASKMKGPWTPFHLNAGPFLVDGGKWRSTRGVMDFGADPERYDWEHVASPDVHVVDRTFVMYFHGLNGPNLELFPNATRLEGGRAPIHHGGFVATSATGLNFNGPRAGGEEGHGPITVTFVDDENNKTTTTTTTNADTTTTTTEVCFTDKYIRVFHRRYQRRNSRGKLETVVDGPFGASKEAKVSRPVDFVQPLGFAKNGSLAHGESLVRKPWDCPNWIRHDKPTAIFNATPTGKFAPEDVSAVHTFLASEEFALHPNNPWKGLRIGAKNRINHVGVFPLEDGRLEVFFWIKGSRVRYPDIYRVILDITSQDLAQWDVSRDPETKQVYLDVIVTPAQATKIVTKALRRQGKKIGNPLYGLDNPLQFATHIRDFGDPFVFWDATDEKKYLFVSYSLPQGIGPFNSSQGEGLITAFRLIPSESER